MSILLKPKRKRGKMLPSQPVPSSSSTSTAVVTSVPIPVSPTDERSFRYQLYPAGDGNGGANAGTTGFTSPSLSVTPMSPPLTHLTDPTLSRRGSIPGDGDVKYYKSTNSLYEVGRGGRGKEEDEVVSVGQYSLV